MLTEAQMKELAKTVRSTGQLKIPEDILQGFFGSNEGLTAWAEENDFELREYPLEENLNLIIIRPRNSVS